MMQQLEYQDQDLLVTLRENHRLLKEISLRFGVDYAAGPGATAPYAIHSPKDTYDLLAPEMAPLHQEQLRVLLLNTKNVVVGQRVVYQGNVNSSIVRPAEVLRPAVVEAVPSIIIAHNHPSGDPTPSPEDIAITRDITKAGKLLGIDLLDHVVIGIKGFKSLSEMDLL